MTQTELSAIIALVGLIMSVLVSVLVAGIWLGSLKQRLEQLQRAQDNMVTRDDLANVREQLAEIRGMFRLTLKEDQAA